MRNLEDLADRPLLELWGEAVRARRVQAERTTLAILELDWDDRSIVEPSPAPRWPEA